MKFKIKNEIVFWSIIFFTASLGVIIMGHLFVHKWTFIWSDFIKDSYTNIASELRGIAISILIINTILKKIERKESELATKNKLLNDLHSPVNSIANNAVHELRSLDKLTGQDAWTVYAKLGGKADLTEARLYDANFFGARLIGANFSKADLRNVNFFDAELTGANLFGANITDSKFNINTILPDGQSWSTDTDLSKYLIQSETLKNQYWYSIDISQNDTDEVNLMEQKMTPRNLILYLKKQFPTIQIAKDELHFYRHYIPLRDFGYETIGEIDELLSRTEEARTWIWQDKVPEYLIIEISYSIALENPKHLSLLHWNGETKDKIKAARKTFYNQ